MKKVLVIFMLILLMCLGGCGGSNTRKTESTNKGSLKVFYNDGFDSVTVYTDPDTKIQYILWDGYEKGGITPRLNADGSLYKGE